MLACGGVPTRPIAPGDAAPVPGTRSWESLGRALPGTWFASIGEHRIEVHYALTSRGTVLLETWMPGTAAETVSTMHLDGEHLMLTHYCGQGNQPRLRLVASTEPEHVFVRFDATDLTDDEAALSRLSLALEGDELTRIETYVRGDESETSTLSFHREALGDSQAAGTN